MDAHSNQTHESSNSEPSAEALLNELENKVNALLIEKRELTKERDVLRLKVEELEHEKKVSGSLSATNRIVLKQQIDKMVKRIDHYLE